MGLFDQSLWGDTHFGGSIGGNGLTTLEIETQANSGDIASADINLKMQLRRNIVPKYLHDLRRLNGNLYWLRKTFTISILADGTRNYDLPADFDWLQKAFVYNTNNQESNFGYIGEDPEEIMRSEASTANGQPSGYYVIPGTVSPFAMRTNTAPNEAATVRGVYYKFIVFSDDETSIQMNLHIPNQYQWGLVHGLRAVIMLDRFGIGDDRYVAESRIYQDWVDKVAQNKENVARRHVIRAS